MQLDEGLNRDWARRYGLINAGSGQSHADRFLCTKVVDVGGFIAAGYTNTPTGANDDMLVMKLNDDGTIGGVETYWNVNGMDDVASSIDEIPSGGYIVTGMSYPPSGVGTDLDLAVMKLDATLSRVWANVLRPYVPPMLTPMTNDDGGSCVEAISDGYIIAGWTQSIWSDWDFLVCKLHPDGYIQDSCLRTCSLDVYSPYSVYDSVELWDPEPFMPDTFPVDFWYDSTWADSVINDTTIYPTQTFIAHFMTPEAEPYPFDLTISDGEWVQEFDSVTYIETEVPDSATYTLVYQREGWEFNHKFRISLSPGEVRECEFYALDFSQMEFQSRPYITMQEVGSNVSLSWEWNPEMDSLAWTVSADSGKHVSLTLGIDDNSSEPPNHAAMTFCWDTSSNVPDSLAPQPSPPNTHEDLWCDIAVMGAAALLFHSNITGYSVFAEIDSGLGTIRIGYGLYRDAILVYPIKTTLRNLEGTLFEKEFVDPQYAVPPDSYILSIDSTPDGYVPLHYPINVEAGKGTNIDNFYIPKIAELSSFTFTIAAENAFAHSSYSNLFHAPGDSISLDVATETEYDWWGCFVLPDSLTVDQLFAYPDTGGVDTLESQIDWIENWTPGYNLEVVRIDPSIIRLNLIYRGCCVLRGDADRSGSINVADPTYLTDYIFFGGPAPPCFEEGDADGSGSINVADPTYLTDYIFFGGPAPPPCP